MYETQYDLLGIYAYVKIIWQVNEDWEETTLDVDLSCVLSSSPVPTSACTCQGNWLSFVIILSRTKLLAIFLQYFHSKKYGSGCSNSFS
jgi:hypothetical protein